MLCVVGYLLGKRGKRASMEIQVERDQRAKLMTQALDAIRLIKSLQVTGFEAFGDILFLFI